MLRLHHCAFVAVALAVGACSQPPIASKPAIPQEAANTVRDWDKAAQRITQELVQRGMLIAPQPGVTPASPPWGPYYVHVQQPNSAFLQGVADSLRTSITNSGGTVSRTPVGAVVINLDVAWVKHGMRDQLAGGEFTTAGAIATLATFAAAGAPYSSPWVGAAAATGALMGSSIIADTYLNAYPVKTGEIMWRATVASPQQVLMQVGGPMYVSASDLALYAGDTRLAEMTTPGTPISVQARRIRYTGAR